MKNLFQLIFAGIIGGMIVLYGVKLSERPAAISATDIYTQQVSQKINVNPSRNAINFDFVQSAEKARPVVVHISASESRDLADRNQQRDRMYDPFNFFFGDDFLWDFLDQVPKQGTGSGVIISEDGYIVTNNHVVDFADEVKVTLFDESTYTATIVGVDPRTDLAVLKIEASNLPTIDYGNSDDARVGEWVLAVGNPFDLTSTVTAGIISAKGRDIDIINRSDAIESFIQTDAAVNPGNSGGALVDIDGKLIGINTAIASPNGAFAGYSFAIPSNMVKNIVDNIINHGAARPRLGVDAYDVDNDLAEELGLAVKEGIFIESVENGGSAQYAGLLPYDVIIEVDGRKVSTGLDLKSILDNSKVGDVLEFIISRNGKKEKILVRLKA